MGFRINTNVGAMNAHMHSLNNNRGLDKSLSALSTGLRINKAADDASGMAIANQLKSQSNGLGQAIRNANDGINVAQTADGALEEYTNIINTIKTKAIQAASDGQNANSRAAIQADIDKLLEEAQNIAKTTSFNGMNLLDGTFKDKKFHIGAYANETVGIDIDSAKTSDIGKLASVNNDGSNKDGVASWNDLESSQLTETGSGYTLNHDQLKINGTSISESLNEKSPTRLLDAKNLAAAISDATGLTAQATTKLEATSAMGATTLDSSNTLKINGFQVADGTYSANDSDGKLVEAINDISDKTGVTASNDGGKIVLTAKDGRNISIKTTGTVNTHFDDHLTDQTSSASVDALESTSTSALTIAKGELIINGVDLAGTYGDNSTAGSAQNDLLSAIRDIAGLETSSIASDGKITLEATNGDDLNIAGSKATSTFHMTKGVYQESERGVVDIISDKKIVIGGDDAGTFGLSSGGYTPQTGSISLNSIDVTSRNGAEVAIQIAEKALKNIDSIRSNIGSVQNQLESTVRNISVTQVNVTAAESTIRDVDFAQESANLKKHNILAQSGVYAMSQANSAQQNVMKLLQ